MAMLTQFEAIRRYSHLPLRERILDELADVLFSIDTILGSLDAEEANNILWIEPEIRRVYDDINKLMLRMSE